MDHTKDLLQAELEIQKSELLEQPQGRICVIQLHRFLLPKKIHFLELFSKGNYGNIGQSQLLQSRLGKFELHGAAVYEYQLRHWFLPVEAVAVTPQQSLLHGAEVVDALHALDVKPSVK